MSISTYTELKTAVENWLNRAGDSTVQDRAAEFIALAEGRLNRKLRALRAETEWTADYTSSSRFVAYPSGMLEIIDVRIKKSTQADSEYEPLIYVPPERMWRYYHADAGEPQYYTLRNQIEINRTADTTYKIRLHGLDKWNIASDSTNWLLTNFPDAYLFGALVEAEAFLEKDQRVPMWNERFKEAIRELDALDLRNRDDADLSVSDLSLMSSSGGMYDIRHDD